MTHYRQIIINLAVEDDTPEEKIEALKDIIEKTAKENADPKEVKEITIRVN